MCCLMASVKFAWSVGDIGKLTWTASLSDAHAFAQPLGFERPTIKIHSFPFMERIELQEVGLMSL